MGRVRTDNWNYFRHCQRCGNVGLVTGRYSRICVDCRKDKYKIPEGFKK